MDIMSFGQLQWGKGKASAVPPGTVQKVPTTFPGVFVASRIWVCHSSKLCSDVGGPLGAGVFCNISGGMEITVHVMGQSLEPAVLGL